MGSYGFGPALRYGGSGGAAFADEKGISWPRLLIAPFDVEIVAIGNPGTKGCAPSPTSSMGNFRGAGLEVLYDDRDAGPGEKFTDAELLGCPLRVTIGRRTLAAGEIEVQVRRRGREARSVPISQAAAEAIAAKLARAALERRSGAMPEQRITKKRLFGIDRSGPPARADTVRSAAEPVDDSRTRSDLRAPGPHSGVPGGGILERRRPGHRRRRCCLRCIGWADYADGFAARLTGQYSSLGALLDPIVDLLLVISGMAVCWHFELLPRWAIALAVAREGVHAGAEPLRPASRPRAEDQLGRATRRCADDGSTVLRDGRCALARADHAVHGPRSGAACDRVVCSKSGFEELSNRKDSAAKHSTSD